MATKVPTRDLTAEISALRQALEQVAQQAKSLANDFEKNTELQDCVLFVEKALNSLSYEDEIWPDPSVKIDWIGFGRKLKRHRRQAGLGQKELADLADVSDSMIRFVEKGEKRPGRKLLLRLLALAPLNLHLGDIIGPSSQPGVVPTLWLATDYDPRKLINDLVERLNGSGCSLEQTTAYLDYQSASDWLATSNAPNYLAAFSNTDALEEVAVRIAERCGAGGVDLIAIGSGDAKREVKLVECLLQHTAKRNIKDVRVFLLDISHTLLTEGHNHAKAVLGERVKSIVALHGDFHQLSQYPLFNHSDQRTRTRVFTLLGCTMANLDHEVPILSRHDERGGAGRFFRC